MPRQSACVPSLPKQPRMSFRRLPRRSEDRFHFAAMRRANLRLPGPIALEPSIPVQRRRSRRARLRSAVRGYCPASDIEPASFIVSDGIVSMFRLASAAELLNEVADQQRNIFRALAQSGHAHREYVQAIVKIRNGNFCSSTMRRQIAVRRRDQPRVGAQSPRRCPAARIRAPAERAAASAAVPAGPRRSRPGTSCRGWPVRSGPYAAKWLR